MNWAAFCLKRLATSPEVLGPRNLQVPSLPSRDCQEKNCCHEHQAITKEYLLVYPFLVCHNQQPPQELLFIGYANDLITSASHVTKPTS
jgi:hypothetical protein